MGVMMQKPSSAKEPELREHYKVSMVNFQWNKLGSRKDEIIYRK